MLLSPWRELRPDDIFRPDADWAKDLAPKVLERVVQKLPEYGATGLDIDTAGLAAEMADPTTWLVTDEGLDIAWGNRENRGWKTVLIPWAMLRPYLVDRPAINVPR
jgi:hypothetical protein